MPLKLLILYYFFKPVLKLNSLNFFELCTNRRPKVAILKWPIPLADSAESAVRLTTLDSGINVAPGIFGKINNHSPLNKRSHPLK